MNTATQAALDKFSQLQEQAKTRLENARVALDPTYQSHLLMIEQSQRLGRLVELVEEDRQALDAAGVWAKQEPDGIFSLFAKVTIPYLSVEGRLRIFQDELKRDGGTFQMTEQVDLANKLITVTITCPKGSACGSARIQETIPGSEFTSPLEAAETSALGRALGFLGYGAGLLETKPAGTGTGEILSAGAVDLATSELPAPPAQPASAPVRAPQRSSPASELSREERYQLYTLARLAGFERPDAIGRPWLDFPAPGHFLKEHGLAGAATKLLRKDYPRALELLRDKAGTLSTARTMQPTPADG